MSAEKIWIPRFLLGIVNRAAPRTIDHLGGLPWGLPPSRWPSCRMCDRPQTFLAQFTSSARVRLGKRGRRLFLFQCDGWGGDGCMTWDRRRGANAAVLVERSDLLDGLTSPPDGDTRIEPEVLVVAWTSRSRPRRDDTDDEVLYGSFAGARPHRLANRVARPRTGDTFLMQLSGHVTVLDENLTARSTGAEIIAPNGRRSSLPPVRRDHWPPWSRGCRDVPGRPSQVVRDEDGLFRVEWANFGGGLLYVYLARDGRRAYQFWER